jgi:hypothetical protein
VNPKPTAIGQRAPHDQSTADGRGHQGSNDEYQLKMTTLARDVAALDKSGKDYTNKLQQLQDKEKQLVQQHENDVTSIREKAEIERNQTILSGEQHFNDQLAQGLTQVLMRHQSFGAMITSIGKSSRFGHDAKRHQERYG